MAEKIKIFSVNEITKLIKTNLESQFKQIWISGEISNFSKSATGHFYFSLKDDSALISCALFRGVANKLNIVNFFDVENLSDLGNYKIVQNKIVGKKIKVYGDISVYAKSGSYQIIVKAMELEGVGELQKKFEELKKKLWKQGYFAEEIKKSLPSFPMRIGVITSPTGAAVRDILNVTRRRWNSASIVLYPAVVQGQDAAPDIVNGIKLFNVHKNVDVIILGRGGGSLEDLWAFNEEIVAQAIFESQIPIISAVGHEVDYAISDFVADLRAPTPSAAAELVVHDKAEVAESVSTQNSTMRRLMQRYIERYKKDMVNVSENRLKHDLNLSLQHYKDKLNNFSQEKLKLSLKYIVKDYKEKLTHLSVDKLSNSLMLTVGQGDSELKHISEKFISLTEKFLSEKKQNFSFLIDKLNLLNPLAILERGYSVTYNSNGQIITTTEALAENENIRTIVAKGEIKSVISNIKRGV